MFVCMHTRRFHVSHTEVLERARIKGDDLLPRGQFKEGRDEEKLGGRRESHCVYIVWVMEMSWAAEGMGVALYSGRSMDRGGRLLQYCYSYRCGTAWKLQYTVIETVISCSNLNISTAFHQCVIVIN